MLDYAYTNDSNDTVLQRKKALFSLMFTKSFSIYLCNMESIPVRMFKKPSCLV